MKSLIVGAGEVGKSLFDVLCEHYQISLYDRSGESDIRYSIDGEIDILHVCFPYSDEFVSEVARYQQICTPRYTVIHSTVPVGTSRICHALHSPVIGMHPFLEKSLRTFTKFIGGEKAGDVADYFRRAGIKAYLFDAQETTEWMKLLDTTFYKKCIEYTQDVKRICVNQNIPFEAWTIWTDVYNIGYQTLGHAEFTRPNLSPIMKEIGGHCLVPNEKMLRESIEGAKKRVLISGGWDLMHYNHVLTLRKAKSYGDWLIVNVMSDERMKLKKGEDRPFIPLAERIEILKELQCVDEVISIPGEEYPLFKAIDQSKPHKVLINVTEQSDVSKEEEYCRSRGIELVKIPRIDDGVSTTSLIKKLRA